MTPHQETLKMVCCLFNSENKKDPLQDFLGLSILCFPHGAVEKFNNDHVTDLGSDATLRQYLKQGQCPTHQSKAAFT